MEYIKYLLTPAWKVMIQLPDHWIIKMGATLFLSLIAVFEQAVYSDFTAFSVLMGFLVLDWITGCWAAFKTGTFSSHRFRDTIVKLFCYMIIVGGLFALERISEIFVFANLDMFALGYLSVTELISILENITRISNVKLPGFIMDKLKRFQQLGKIS